MRTRVVRIRSGVSISILVWVLVTAAAFASSQIVSNAAHWVKGDSKAMQQEVKGACDCQDLNDLVNRKYEVEAAIAKLKQEIEVVLASYRDPNNPQLNLYSTIRHLLDADIQEAINAVPTLYVDSTDRRLLDADIEDAINSVRDPSLKNHTKNMTFSPECDSSVQGDTLCLHQAAKAGEAAYIAYCQGRHGFSSDWQERTRLTILLYKAQEAYDAELKYIDHQINNLKVRCKTKGWSGQIVVTYEDKFDSRNTTPGTIQGTETIANRDYRDATITIFEGKAVGELSVGLNDTTTTTKSGQTSCHGGGITPKLSSFSSSQTSTIEKKGDFYNRPSFQITFDGAGNYKIALTMKGGYGYGTTSYVSSYEGECGKPEPERHTVLPKEFLDGITVVGQGHGRASDLKLSDSATPVKEFGIIGHATRTKTVKIQWTLSRDSAQYIAR